MVYSYSYNDVSNLCCFFFVNDNKDKNTSNEISKNNVTWESQYFDYNTLSNYADGSGQVLALIDSGISKFQINKVKKSESFVQNNYDINGHGTMLCSLILGYKDEVYGIAPETDVISYNIVNQEGKTSPEIIVKAIDKAVEDKADVINISLGSYFDNPQVKQAINVAYTAGVIVVASAGDYGSTQMLYPARYSNTISVGALDNNNKI